MGICQITKKRRVYSAAPNRSKNPGLVDSYADCCRCDSIDNHLERTRARGDRSRNIELSGANGRAGLDAAEPVVRSAIHNVSSGIGDANQREVRGALVIVTVVRTLRHTVELRSLDHVIPAAVGECGGYAADGRSAT